jgi:hypothetical protein
MPNKEQIIHDMHIKLEVLCGLKKIAIEQQCSVMLKIVEEKIEELEKKIGELQND